MAELTRFDIIAMAALAISATVFYLFHDLFTSEQRKLIFVRNVYTINLFIMILTGVITVIRLGMLATSGKGSGANRRNNRV